ncbi:hypothetical protein ACFL6S_18445 [Candidatus Poribacteria bacterium]
MKYRLISAAMAVIGLILLLVPHIYIPHQLIVGFAIMVGAAVLWGGIPKNMGKKVRVSVPFVILVAAIVITYVQMYGIEELQKTFFGWMLGVGVVAAIFAWLKFKK